MFHLKCEIYIDDFFWLFSGYQINWTLPARIANSSSQSSTRTLHFLFTKKHNNVSDNKVHSLILKTYLAIIVSNEDTKQASQKCQIKSYYEKN